MNRPIKFVCAMLAVVLSGAAHSVLADPQTIVIYGASGNIGGKIVTEALNRGHKVIGVSRNPAKLKVGGANFSAVAGDVTDVDSILQTIDGADAVVVSVQGTAPGNLAHDTVHAKSSVALIAAARKGGDTAPRIVQVGGAATMANSRYTMDQEIPHLGFRAPVGSPLYAMLFGHWIALQNFRNSDIKWSVATPAGDIEAGDRTGAYRIDTETRVVDAAGKSFISQEDFAVAIIDELENPRFVGQRFNVGY